LLNCCKEMVLPQIHAHARVGRPCGKALLRKGLKGFKATVSWALDHLLTVYIVVSLFKRSGSFEHRRSGDGVKIRSDRPDFAAVSRKCHHSAKAGINARFVTATQDAPNRGDWQQPFAYLRL